MSYRTLAMTFALTTVALMGVTTTRASEDNTTRVSTMPTAQRRLAGSNLQHPQYWRSHSAGTGSESEMPRSGSTGDATPNYRRRLGSGCATIPLSSLPRQCQVPRSETQAKNATADASHAGSARNPGVRCNGRPSTQLPRYCQK